MSARDATQDMTQGVGEAAPQDRVQDTGIQDAGAVSVQGPGTYFDGLCSTRNLVAVEAGTDRLRILGPDHAALDEWSYAELRRKSAPDGVLRLGRNDETAPARLEIRDPALAAIIEDRAATLDRSGAAARRLHRWIVVLALAAGVSLVLTAIVGLPVLAAKILPYVPLTVERRLGEAVDKEVRSNLDPQHLGAAFSCGTAPDEAAGMAAMNKLVAALESRAALPVRLHVDVVHRDEANAVALPGGQVYVYEGLIARAQTPDELAGVLAHEIGHVANRDGTRAVLQAAGLSFMFGMLLGDFVGGGAVVIAARTILHSAYSRRVEAGADAYSVDLMQKAGGDPVALAAILSRIVDDKEQGMKILLDHPETKDRIAAIRARASQAATRALLTPSEWTALKHICASGAIAPSGSGRK